MGPCVGRGKVSVDFLDGVGVLARHGVSRGMEEYFRGAVFFVFRRGKRPETPGVSAVWNPYWGHASFLENLFRPCRGVTRWVSYRGL